MTSDVIFRVEEDAEFVEQGGIGLEFEVIIYILDSDLGWRMPLLIIIMVKKSCCVCREFDAY